MDIPREGCSTETIGKKAPIRRTVLSAITASVLLTAAMGLAVQSAALRVVIIGDSTVQTYTAADSLRGWGQELPLFFNNGAVTVINKAIGGRSSRSFIEDGHWASTLPILQKGDYLFIQFGHNDRDTKVERYTDTAGYRKYLTQYVTESRAKGAFPILVSSMNMNAWNGTTLREVFNEGANDYHAAMIRVVNEQKVPFIDLEQKTAKLFQSLGQAYLAAFVFNTGEGTHFQEMGALMNARFIAEGIKELSSDTDVGKLAAVLGPQYLVTVTPNKTGAGMITASGTYPAGALMTIKVVPNSGQTFQRWQDADGKSLTTQTKYPFTMGTAAVSYYAMYQGGTPIIAGNRQPAGARQTGKVSIVENHDRSIAIQTREPLISVRVTDLAGRTVLHKRPGVCRIDLDEREITGARAVTVSTSSGSRTGLVLPSR
jgi:lysophospholipase L1-like esterase